MSAGKVSLKAGLAHMNERRAGPEFERQALEVFDVTQNLPSIVTEI